MPLQKGEYTVLNEALKKLETALERLSVVQTQIGEHIIKCNSLQEASKDWRTQVNQRIIEIQISQQNAEKNFAKTTKKIDKKLAKAVVALDDRIDKSNAKSQKWQMAQLTALCAILLTVLGAILSETIHFGARIDVPTQTEVHRGR